VATAVRDTVHSLALYTLPGPASPRIRARVLAAVTGPDRIQPFAVDLARFFSRSTSTPPARYVGRVDRPQGWLEDAAGIRLLSPQPRRRPTCPSDSDPTTPTTPS
jgi:hypothetical protein